MSCFSDIHQTSVWSHYFSHLLKAYWEKSVSSSKKVYHSFFFSNSIGNNCDQCIRLPMQSGIVLVALGLLLRFWFRLKTACTNDVEYCSSSLGRKMIQIVHVTNLIVNRNFSTLAWSQSASGERFQRLERSSNLTQQWLQKEIQMANDLQFSLLPIG